MLSGNSQQRFLITCIRKELPVAGPVDTIKSLHHFYTY